MLDVLDHIGLIAFAISGVLVAANRRLDVLGALIIAFITALGGGTVRDLLLNEPVAWTKSVSQVTVVVIAATIGIFFHRFLRKWRITLFIMDAIGLAAFTVVGVQKGLEHDQMYLTAVFLGMITATFGGLIRDVLANEIPIIFREELYAIPCLAGGALYLIGYHFGFEHSSWLLWLTIVFIIAFRILAIVFSWKSPILKN